MLFIIILSHILNGYVHVYGFPGGAPWDTCLTMFPKHGGQRQTTPSPFQTIPNSTVYNPAEVIQLNINATQIGRTLKGIQIRARPKFGDIEQIVGQFTDWPANKTQTLNCLGGQKNMVTHSNSLPVQMIQLQWRAPNISVGDIEFVISYVEDFTHFWVDEIVEITAAVGIVVPEVEQLSRKFEIIDWSECGNIRGCFLYPRICRGYDCYAAVTYRAMNGSVEFEMFGSRDGYISLGFSQDKLMGGDETVTCTAGDGNVAIQRGYNHDELYNERQFKSGLYSIQGTYKDGRLYCRFTRPMLMFTYVGEGHTGKKYYDLSNDYYLMLAWGPKYYGTEVMGIHVELPPISEKKVNFRENTVIRGSSLPMTKQLHGALMLVAWILLVSIATTVSRHFKEGFNGSNICGAKVWFQIHRCLAVLAWLLTVAGFVLIFVVVGELTENAKPHSYFGITVMAGSTVQIVMAIIRPEPESSIRTLFNWCHWFLGKSTHVVAAVALFLAFNNKMIPLPQQRFSNIVLGVTVTHQVLWEIGFECIIIYSKKKASENYELKSMTKSKGNPDNDYLASESRIASREQALVVYVLCTLALSLAALASIFLF